ncbi:MAG: inorganic diphosphatase [Candidatus Parvarchaeota archaeon]|nr:inorganic diphosphatase [Candidatus Jingweiarchaeum tengchongense]MCW1298170.1 inorganic diphosphatase [Candidatus Jingweiarchaeum tengchongense]MCW1299968.1 inorganic diphosphatase [Candidatus Jingweiarchaeum tengchongense]MCW1305047.1 inorganic diphosphatase [Candidatus Jingweiarchaeum tengchongense]MCW1305590.1 inorganic diphosphatase [Candidatus Jingweiarchaeum tengchongense]
MSLWKDIPVGDKPPKIVNAIIEVISGSRDKYEYNREWDAFVLDRILFSSVVFPIEYGFIPQTWYHDNDTLDIMVLSYEPLEVGCVIKVRVIGALLMEDESGEDSKILAVPVNDPRFDGINDIKDVHPHKLKEIQEFIESYKRLEPNKWVKFKGWENAKEAERIVQDAIDLYKKKFKK